MLNKLAGREAELGLIGNLFTRCRRGDLNPHPGLPGLGPQPGTAHCTLRDLSLSRVVTCTDERDLVGVMVPGDTGSGATCGNAWGNMWPGSLSKSVPKRSVQRLKRGAEPLDLGTRAS
jgi:hypothetical protein